jgi:hypothetical protein
MKTVVKTVKFSPGEARKLRSTAKARRVTESDIVRAAVKREIADDGVDMVAEVGADFGCVRSGDPRPVGEKLKDFGRAQPR